jgi:uncharacterized protein
MESLKELVEVVARSLVDHPEAVDVSEREGGQSSLMELRVAHEDLGAVIGRRGQTVDAMRTLLAAAGAKLKRRIILDVIE